ncbi:MAG: hypothetical protein DMG01_04745 [Acidobacteria bacterium]|nr:MAG: hypothetical protein DMG01_04745 [Acidobacteriota bacterium]
MNAGPAYKLGRYATLTLGLVASLVSCDRRPADGPAPVGAAISARSAPASELLAGGDTHSYRLELKSADYVELRVEHHGIDVAVALLAPDGEPLFTVAFREPGSVTIAHIARTPGGHLLRISSIDKPPSSGTYAIRINALRRSGPQDSARVEGWRAFTVAEALYVDWRADTTRDDDRVDQALARLQMGQAYHALGRVDDALRQLLDAQRVNSGLDPDLACAGLNAIARVQLDLGASAKARDAAERAQRLATTTRNQACEAEALNVGGDLALYGGHVRESIAPFSKAASISERLGDRRGHARALLNLGYAHADLGDTDESERLYTSALALWRSVGNVRGEAQSLTGLGQLLGMTGQDRDALDRYEQARLLFERLGDRIGLASVLGSIGIRRSRSGDLISAVDYIRKAADLFKTIKNQNGEAAARLNLAICLAAQNRHVEALEEDVQALSISRAITDRKLEARALHAMGQTYAALGAHTDAQKFLEESSTLAQTVGDPRGQGYALDALARLLHERGHDREALTRLETALQVSRASKERFLESQILYDLATAQTTVGELDAALKSVNQSLELVEGLRTAVASLDFRASLVASMRDRYELQVDLLMRLREPRLAESRVALAFEASERARARSFLDALAQARSGIREGVAPDVLRREAAVRRALDVAAQRLTLQADASGREAAELNAELDRQLAAYRDIETQIRTLSPRYASLMEPRPLTVAQIQQLIGDDRTVILEYFLGKNHSYIWAVTRSNITGHVLPPRDEIERCVQRYRDALTTAARLDAVGTASAMRSVGGLTGPKRRAQLERLARDVAHTVLEPIAQYLNRPRVVVVADGILQQLPFAAIPDPTCCPSTASIAPMITAHEMISLPSASTLSLLGVDVSESDDARFGSERARATVEAAPSTRGETQSTAAVRMPRLTRTGREARDIAAVASPTDVVLGFDASRAAAANVNFANYRIVHFAAHGIMDDRHPELSGIVLSLFNRNGESQDGFLRLHDIHNLNIPADLVVLSACSTALGTEVVGEGLIGLVRGFMYAGAASVVASLWPVDDEATSELMARFYRQMFVRHLTPPAALRAAQLEMVRDNRWSEPFYWASFTIQGRWN